MKSSTVETVLFIALGILATLLLFAVCAGLALIPVLLLMWAWNAFMVPVFHLPAITFWMAFALSILLSALRSTVSIVKNARRRAERDAE